jgi:thymidine kinase
MINEPSYLPPEYGWIEVICGGMFSGKTEELIRRAKRAKIAGQKVLVVKPKTDNRYSDTEVVSHNDTAIPSVVVSESNHIIDLSNDFQVICIDEAQFFDNEIVNIANQLANHQKRVIVAGLDMDYEGKPFGPMPYLLAVAEFVTKLHAICTKSGMLASYSQRVVEGTEQVMVGEYDAYEPRARHCFSRGIEKREAAFISPHKI